MVPKYAFRCDVTYRVGVVLVTKASNHEYLPAAMVARDKALAKPGTSKVTVSVILDETYKGRDSIAASFNP
jgi:hypothetical protein